MHFNPQLFKVSVIQRKLFGPLDFELSRFHCILYSLKPASVPQLDVLPLPGLQYSFVDIDHEIFSMVILSLPLIQERHLSVSGKRMCTILVNCLVD